MKRSLLLAISGLMLFTLSFPAHAAEKDITVYTARLRDTEKTLYARAQEKTEIPVTIEKRKPGERTKRIVEEGPAAQADLFVTVDGSILQSAKAKGILGSIPAQAIATIPPTSGDRPQAKKLPAASLVYPL